MAKTNNPSLKQLVTEWRGFSGVVTTAHPNRKLYEQDPNSVQSKPVAQTKPQVQPNPTPQVKPKVTTQAPPSEPPVTDVPEESPVEDTTLNMQVSPGYKVEFEGKPGKYYIIRIMNTKMTNFLVVNEKLGKPVQFVNVKVNSIESDEKGKPFKGSEDNSAPENTQQTNDVENLQEIYKSVGISLKGLLSEKWLYREMEKPKMSDDEKKSLLEMISKFNEYGKHIYRADELKKITEEMSHIITKAQDITLQESGEWFDNVTVSRHMKGLDNSMKLFEKTSKEIGILQQRLENLYEDMGSILAKYYDIKDLDSNNVGNNSMINEMSDFSLKKSLDSTKLNIGDIIRKDKQFSGVQLEITKILPDSVIVKNLSTHNNFSIPKKDLETIYVPVKTKVNAKINEAAIATDYQFTPKQFDFLKKQGVKMSTNGEEMYIPDNIKNEIEKNISTSNFKRNFSALFDSDKQAMAGQILGAIKRSLKDYLYMTDSNNVRKKYFVLRGHTTKSGNFNFPNPGRIKNEPITIKPKASVPRMGSNEMN